MSSYPYANDPGIGWQPVPGDQRKHGLNMWFDRDIDAIMGRTQKRPCLLAWYSRRSFEIGLALIDPGCWLGVDP